MDFTLDMNHKSAKENRLVLSRCPRKAPQSISEQSDGGFQNKSTLKIMSSLFSG